MLQRPRPEPACDAGAPLQPHHRGGPAEIVQYRAQYAIAIGGSFPQTQELTGTYSLEHPSRRSADAPQPGEPSQPGTIQQLNLGFQATWEIDIWGKYRRNAEAAKGCLCKAPMRAMNSRS